VGTAAAGVPLMEGLGISNGEGRVIGGVGSGPGIANEALNPANSNDIGGKIALGFGIIFGFLGTPEVAIAAASVPAVKDLSEGFYPIYNNRYMPYEGPPGP